VSNQPRSRFWLWVFIWAMFLSPTIDHGARSEAEKLKARVEALQKGIEELEAEFDRMESGREPSE
jgi:hypothetical protein